MMGVKWSTWKPMFLPETNSLMETLQGQVEAFLTTLDQDRISSRKLKNLMGLCTIAPRTWAKVIERCTGSKEEDHVGLCTVRWKLQGQSLVKQTPESLGFSVEMA